MFFKEGMNGFSQDPLSFSVDNSHLIDAFLSTCPKIFICGGGHLLGVKCVEVKYPINGDMDQVIIWHDKVKFEIRVLSLYFLDSKRNSVSFA